MIKINLPVKKKAAAPKTVKVKVQAVPMVESMRRTAEDRKREQRYQAEEDIRTMQRMAEIKQDPGRLGRIEAILQNQMNAVKAVKGK